MVPQGRLAVRHLRRGVVSADLRTLEKAGGREADRFYWDRGGIARLPALFHADTEPVLQLVERGEAAILEGLVPQAPEHQPGRLVITAEQPGRPLQCLCLVLLVHRDLLCSDSAT
jgi:hypothetical protein